MIAGFFAMGSNLINSYEVALVKPNHGGQGSEIHLTNSKIVYCNMKPGEVMERIAEAREENEKC